MKQVTAGVDRARIERAVLEIIAAIGDDPEREGLRETPRRIAETYAELFSGIGCDPTEVLSKSARGRRLAQEAAAATADGTDVKAA